jgi:hypothetical protein
MLCRSQSGREGGALSTWDHEYALIEVPDQWYGPEATLFKVRTDDGNLYILRHARAADQWTLESFRHQRSVAQLKTTGFKRTAPV